LQVDNAELWSIARPYLYDLTTEIVDSNNNVLDNFTTAIGIHLDRCAKAKSWDSKNTGRATLQIE
jgi:hypothetical protein